MKVSDQPREGYLFEAVFLIWIVKENQIGIGILTFQRDVMNTVRQDAWIVVLLTALIVHMVAYTMIKTLERYPSADLYGIHHDVYGKWLGSFLSSIYMFYLLLSAIIILRRYIEMVHVWLFPTLPMWMLALVILLVVNYAILAGIRVIVGFCFISFFFSIWIVLFLSYNLPYMEWNHFYPLAENFGVSYFEAIYTMIFAIIGFEIIYFIYPFVKDKKAIQKYAHIGIISTTSIYLILMVISIGFYSLGEVNLYSSPTLRLFKVIKLPFLERLEVVVVNTWLIIILPNLLLYIWAATRGMKRVFQWKQKYALYLFSVLVFIGCILIESRQVIINLTPYINAMSFSIVFVYPFILFLGVWMMRKGRMDKNGDI